MLQWVTAKYVMEFIYMYLYMCDHDDVVQQTRVFLKEMFALHDIWRIFHWPIIYNLINHKFFHYQKKYLFLYLYKKMYSYCALVCEKEVS